MKIFRSEFTHSYKTYSFGYAIYAEKENKDALHDIYASGFIPYSGEAYIKNTLYMARSARVNLQKFKLNSENRRILKKFEGVFSRESIPIKKFNTTDTEFLSFCLKYFKERHGKDVMPKERLLTILEAGFITHIIVYKHDDKIVGYVLEANDKKMGHFWFSFYDLDYAHKSLGLWIMIDCIQYAKNEDKSHYYIGTVYGEKALYKTNFDSLEYWNGNSWEKDIKKLKKKSRTDKDRTFDIFDEWKENSKLF